MCLIWARRGEARQGEARRGGMDEEESGKEGREEGRRKSRSRSNRQSPASPSLQDFQSNPVQLTSGSDSDASRPSKRQVTGGNKICGPSSLSSVKVRHRTGQDRTGQDRTGQEDGNSHPSHLILPIPHLRHRHPHRLILILILILILMPIPPSLPIHPSIQRARVARVGQRCPDPPAFLPRRGAASPLWAPACRFARFGSPFPVLSVLSRDSSLAIQLTYLGTYYLATYLPLYS
ncbi:hypothetical protein DM02DRAFT_629642 [Periconia macrospinosa]|uniref:Uncharacterized protein n=1 Tax=Periconia macrospinosa TaxID=97972 RepID=A0A2V1DLV9_9PLEO|nr:hypothetical protein DM02DRAFT_629642 [Periconia macrospinosa]